LRVKDRAAVTLCLILLAACSGGASGGGRASIEVGVDLPLTGPEARAALPALNGVRYFFQRHPKVDGFDVAVVSLDDAHGDAANPQLGQTNVQQLIADPRLLGMIGPFDASVARREIPIANTAQLAMISPAASSPCLTKDLYLPPLLNPARTAITCKDAGVPAASQLRPTGLNNFFRLVTTDELEGPAAADYASTTLHLVRVGVISDHESYGEALVDAFTSRFQRLGGSVLGHLDFNPAGTQDPTTWLEQMKAAGAQAIYFGGATGGKGCSIRSAMKGIFDAGEATPFLGGDGIAQDPACVSEAGTNAAGIYATVPAVDPDSVAAAAPLIAAFKSAYPKPNDYGPYTLLGYDAAAVLYAAIDRAVRAAGGQAPPRGNVVSQLTVSSSLAGATGPLAFDTAGDTTHRIVSLYEPAGADPKLPWRFVQAVDYSAALPF